MPNAVKSPPVAEESSPFIRMSVPPVKGCNIRTIFGHKEFKGEVGIEIEVEGNKFPKPKTTYDSYGDPVAFNVCDELPDRWGYVHDGSLRGADNAEYILVQDTKFEEVPEAIDDLWKMFNDFGSKLDDSNRTSIHVHLNAQKWHLNRVCSFFGLYFIVEDILTHWCGDHRVGNLFCLRAKDAPGIVSRMKQFLKSEHGWVLDNGMHYSGLNAHALKKLGSIEVRTMRGVQDPELIKTWVGVLERIYHLSGEFTDPRDVVHGFSGQTRMSFLKSVLGSYTDQIVEESGMSGQQIEEALTEGIRLAQGLCYCRDWSLYEPVDCEPDAFGRLPMQAGGQPEPVVATPLSPAYLTVNPAAEINWDTVEAMAQYIGDLDDDFDDD